MNMVVKQGIIMGLVAGVTAPLVTFGMITAYDYARELRRQVAHQTIAYEDIPTQPAYVQKRADTMTVALKEWQSACLAAREWECNAQGIMVGNFDRALDDACKRAGKKSKTCRDLAALRKQYIGWANARSST